MTFSTYSYPSIKNSITAFFCFSWFFSILFCSIFYRYLVTLNGSFFCWLAFGAPLLPNSKINYYHKYIAYIGIYLCHYSFYIACKKEPGVITHENIEMFNHHKYDGVLYVEGYGCRTCTTPKVRTTTIYFLYIYL